MMHLNNRGKEVWNVDRNEFQCCCCLLPTSFFILFLLSLLFFLFSPYPTLPFPFSISLFTIALSPSSSCRYLTSCVKSKYYITKWVEDVNKNTEGPYIRYTNIRLHYICPYSSVSLLSCSFPWPNIIFQRWELSVRVWRALAGRKRHESSQNQI